MFKKLLFLLGLMVFSVGIQAQSINGNILHDNLIRDFIVHLPPNYSENETYPLVLNLHGRGSNAAQQEFYSQMNVVADSANFIVVYPQSTTDSTTQTTIWNIGFGNVFYPVDDVGFISNLIDTLVNDYNIDTNKVYSCGMSMGGYMSYRLACELQDKVVAIASVTGVMTRERIDVCEPQRTVPVLHFHGTNDFTVLYDGDSFSASAEESVAYWGDFNNCDAEVLVEDLPDINESDNSTLTKLSYTNCDNDANVILYRMNDAGHTWPGALFDIGITNRDIHGSEAIWQFFKGYSMTDFYEIEDTTTLTINQIPKKIPLSTYPNPFQDSFFINTNGEYKKVEIINSFGQIMMEVNVNKTKTIVDTKSWVEGVYWVKIMENGGGVYSQKIIKI